MNTPKLKTAWPTGAWSEHPVVYLDQNHLSRIARHPEDPVVRRLAPVLQSGNIALAVSPWVAFETSSPTFRDRLLVGRFVDSCAVVWAVTPERLFDMETVQAFDIYIGGKIRRPTPWVSHYKDCGWLAPFEAQDVEGFGAVMEVMAANEEARNPILELAKHFATESDCLKGKAFVATDLVGPLKQRMSERLDKWPGTTASGIEIRGVPDPNKVIDAVGGLAGFPAWAAWTLALLPRLQDPNWNSKVNDVIDEFHVLHIPYAAVAVLERKTANRLKSIPVMDALCPLLFSTLDEAMPAIMNLVGRR